MFILSDYSLYQIMYLFIFRNYHLRQVLDKALLRVLLDEVNKTNKQTNCAADIQKRHVDTMKLA